MAKRKTNSYWLSLIALLLVASMVLSIGDTQARYVNTTVWNTVVYPTSDQIVSDCLRPEGQTILLGEMELDALEISFTLESTRAISGKLTAAVDLEELLMVELSQEKVEMEAYETVEITMTLIPTDMAIDTPRPEVDVDILVALEGMLSGTFRVTLPELTEEDLGIVPTDPEETEPEETEPEETEPETTEPDPTEPEVTEPEATEPDSTEPEATEPDPTESDPTEPDPTEPEQSEPTESTESTDSTQNTQESTESKPDDQPGEDPAASETSGDSVPEGETAQQETEVLFAAVPRYLRGAIIGTVSTGRSGSFSSASNTENGGVPIEEAPDSSESSEPSEEPSESTGENSDPSKDTTASSEESETTEGSEDEEQEPAPDAIGVRLFTLEAFDPDADLPVQILPEEDTTRVVLGFGMEEEGVITITDFPRYTRYSLDGENYFMFYFGGLIELDTTAVADKTLLLDLGDIGLTRSQAVPLAARAYDGRKLLGSTSTHSVAAADIDYGISTKVITDNVPTMILTLPDEWKGCELDYEVSLLVANQETGVMKYQFVKLGESLKANHSYGASSPHWLTLELGEEKPQPGTYRLNMSWTFEGVCFAETQTTFFINYSGSR